MLEAQKKAFVQQEKLAVTAVGMQEQLIQLREEMLSVSRISQRNHKRTREHTTDANDNLLSMILSKMDDMCGAMRKSTPAGARSDRQIHFIGETRQQLLLPFLHLKNEFSQAIPHFFSSCQNHLLLRSIYELQSKLESLVSSMLQEAASESVGSTATSFDCWTYTENTVGLHKIPVQPNDGLLVENAAPTAQSLARTASLDGADLGKRNLRLCPQHQTCSRSRHKQLHCKCRVFKYNSSAGHLSIATSRASGRSKQPETVEVSSVLFSPSPEANSTSILAKFIERTHEPSLYIQINAFRIVDSCDPHTSVIDRGTLEEIDSTSRNGTITPYDVDATTGHSICIWVSFCCRSPEFFMRCSC